MCQCKILPNKTIRNSPRKYNPKISIKTTPHKLNPGKTKTINPNLPKTIGQKSSIQNSPRQKSPMEVEKFSQEKHSE